MIRDGGGKASFIECNVGDHDAAKAMVEQAANEAGRLDILVNVAGVGGGGKRLVAYVVAAWVGFAAGQAIGDVMHITALAVGPTNLLAATLGAVVAIAATAVLSGRGV